MRDSLLTHSGPDGGPLYRETDISMFPVDKWSTYSNIIFLLLFIYWLFKIWKNRKEYSFLFYCLPVILIGYIGGTVYHAIRSHPFWIFLDVLPIFILCICVAIYFWRKLQPKWYVVTGSILLPILLAILCFQLFNIPEALKPSVGYSSMAFMVIIPIILYIHKTRYIYSFYFFAAMASLLIALLFRSIDLKADIPFLLMGTHWLWHLFGGLTAHLIILYVYRIRKRELKG